MRFITADRIFDGHRFLNENAVLVLGERSHFVEIVNSKDLDAANIERLEGIITPGFVNAHCHLELSHLKNKVPEHIGLPSFARQIILQRNKCAPEEIREAHKQADREMWSKGIVAVGDISNAEDSFAQKVESHIFYHTFIELIGLNPANANLVFERGLELFKKLKDHQLKGSLAPHAPYSTSNHLIKKIADFDKEQDLPLSIHNQESEEELKFFMGEKSGFDELYKFLNLDVSWFKAPHQSSLQAYAAQLSDKKSLLIHNTFTSSDDFKHLENKNIFWCFCPCANLYIGNQLPDFTLFKQLQNSICLGTDSLASNKQLDLIAEANEILKVTTVFSLETLLQALTFNAAEVLGISHAFGQLVKNRNAGLNLISHKNNQLQFIKKIV